MADSDEQAKGGEDEKEPEEKEKEDEQEAPPAPPPRREMTLEEEERAMKTGGWKLPVMLGGGAVVIIAAVVYFSMSGRKVEEVERVAGSLNRLHTEHYIAFWGCTKIPIDMKRYKAMDDVTLRIAKTARGFEKVYATHVRDKCFPILGDYAERVAVMETPEEMQESVRALAGKIREVRSSWDEFTRYLERAEPDLEAHQEKAVRVVKALADYTQGRNQLAEVTNKLRGEEEVR